jgi:alpha-glucosidase
VLECYPDRVLIGEIYLPFERLVAYYGQDLKGAQLPFNFALIHASWDAQTIANLIAEYERSLPPRGWPNWVLGNHDQPRIAARVGAAQARVAAMLLLTLRGTPTMYYGDEIGLARVDVPLEQAQDPWEKNEPGLSVGRDPWRTPLQWDDSINAGFSSGLPWLPLDPNYQKRNVASLRSDEHSILSLYRDLIQIRRAHPSLSLGDARVLSFENDVLLFERSYEDERIVVALNFGEDNRMPNFAGSGDGVFLISSHMDRKGTARGLILRGNEGVVLLMKVKRTANS